MIERVDPTKAPDGACWTVVQRQDGVEVSRSRFGDEATALEYARVMSGKDGCLVHIEGPAGGPIQAIDS